MAQKVNAAKADTGGKLTATGIRGRLADGWYGDGGGLYLQVRNGGAARSWILRWKRDGRTKIMGLGSLDKIGLAAARKAREEHQAAILERRDPLAEREARDRARREAEAKVVTFQQAAERLIKSKAAGWKNAKHADQWEATLRAYCYPVFGDLSVAAVDTGLVMKALEPIWTTKTETASRVRQRIESVLNWATAHKLRSGENPARWKGHLENLLAKPTTIRDVNHFEALPYAQVPALFVKLKTKTTPSARALQWLIMAASRTAETRFADYSEISFEDRTWTIPKERMKSKKPHVVPITDEMLALLDRDGKGLIFPSSEKPGEAMSDATLLKFLRETIGNDTVTTHGMRSAFKDWCREQTNFAHEVSEAALAHVIKDKTVKAYARSDLLEKRRQLMKAWSAFCNTPSAAGGDKVVPIRGA